MNDIGACKAVIASRKIDGIDQIKWPRFCIQPLREKQRIDLIRKKKLPKSVCNNLINEIENAVDPIRDMAKNPMFLSLLCENVRNGKKFPEHVHDVYEDFINTRLDHDENRVSERFGIAKDVIRSTCEQIAFCMTTVDGLGLGPTRSKLLATMDEQKYPPLLSFDKILDGIEYIKLGKPHRDPENGNIEFSFYHRRFQEYFATCKVRKLLSEKAEDQRIHTKQFIDG